jgi:hypothetical protein
MMLNDENTLITEFLIMNQMGTVLMRWQTSGDIYYSPRTPEITHHGSVLFHHSPELFVTVGPATNIFSGELSSAAFRPRRHHKVNI